VKAFDIKQALLEQSSRWPDAVPFVTLCNGFIIREISEAIPHLGHRLVRMGMTTIGSRINTDQSVTIFQQDTTTAWGPWDPLRTPKATPTPGELQLLRQFPNGQWHQDMRPLICRKWILNVVLNSLCAAHALERNARLREFRHEAEALLIEAHELARKLWPNLPEFPSIQDASETLWRVVAATAGNENSMARDHRLGRPTESDFLAGMARDFEGFPALKAIHAKLSAGKASR
jgi:ketopantoate reductase